MPLLDSGCACCSQDAGSKALAAMKGSSKAGTYMQIVDGVFQDDRWVDGRWVLSSFAGADGETDWDKVWKPILGIQPCNSDYLGSFELEHVVHKLCVEQC